MCVTVRTFGFEQMSHRECPGRGTSGDSSPCGGVAAVIAMLQSEQRGGPQVSHQPKAATGERQSKRKACEALALETRTGAAIRSELDLDLLVLKRQKLIQLSKQVLEARCPGFCSRARLTDDEYLREASHALAVITTDVEDAASAHAAFTAVAGSR